MASKSLKPRNQTFQWLEALAIIMVVDNHVDSHVGILSGVFPYDSFFMPMLVFVSGYFFKDRAIADGVRHKVKHLFIPYIVWSLAGDALSWILMRCGLVNWYVSPFSVKSILRLAGGAPLSSITGAGWFVIMLFWVEAGYLVLNRLLHLGSRKPDFIFLAIMVLGGFIDLKLCVDGATQNSDVLAILLRDFWYLQFYHMGRMFRQYWEKHVAHWRLLYVCGICFAINTVLICIFHDKVLFLATSSMRSFHSWWLPLVTSITGTLFWYKVMQMAASRIGQVNIVDFVAENTFTIMMSHLIFTNIPNFVVYLQLQGGNAAYSDFPVQKFTSDAWVRYSPASCLAGFVCGVLGSLLVALLISKAKELLSHQKPRLAGQKQA
jgi:fucose 4-O-acetylase-like acetyltransferase